MATPIPMITGTTGPFTQKPGGFGRNAAHNVRQFQAEPAAANNNAPSSPFLNPVLLEVISGLFSGKPLDAEELLGKVQEGLKSMLPSSRPLPDVQYTQPVSVGMADVEPFFPAPGNFQDALGFAAESLKASQAGPNPFDLGSPGEEIKAQKEKIDNMIKPYLPLLENFLGEQGKEIAEKIESAMNASPEELLEQIKDDPTFGNIGNALPGLKNNSGLSNDILDVNKDGKVSLAEKAAETLFLDDSANLLKAALDTKVNGGLTAQEDFAKLQVLETALEEIQDKSSTFDGVITTAERKIALKAAENPTIGAVISEVLGELILTHDLGSKADAFQAAADQ